MSAERRFEGTARAPDPDWEALLRCLRREGTPRRVHHLELFHDGEVVAALATRFGLVEDLDPAAADFGRRRELAVYRFLGFDYVRAIWDLGLETAPHSVAEDTAGLARKGGRSFLQGGSAAIRCWEDFEKHRWPDPKAFATDGLEWAARFVPEDMCLCASSGHFTEFPMWLMGMEGFCTGIYEQPDLVAAVIQRCGELQIKAIEVLLQFDRIQWIWGSDDMGFASGTFVAPAYMREHILPWHKKAAELCHARGRLYLMHACGNLYKIMEDLIEDVGVDGKHSFQDTFEPIALAKQRWGDRIALLGGVDVDFLCRYDEGAIRRYVRDALEVCMPGGGYCLGTGNSVANYIPLEHYLAMVDEGNVWRG
jgi:uroporphyrinogen decarboxylase